MSYQYLTIMIVIDPHNLMRPSIIERNEDDQVVTVEASDDDRHFRNCEKSDDDDITKKIDRGEHERNVKASLVLIVLQPIEATNNAAVTLSPLGTILRLYTRNAPSQDFASMMIYCGIVPYRGHDDVDVQKHDQRVHGPLNVHDTVAIRPGKRHQQP